MTELRRYRLYLMGYAPPEFDADTVSKEAIEKMMASCDFCFTKTNGSGVEIGEVITITQHYAGPWGTGPGIGTRLRCVEQLHHGKVVVVEEVAPS